MIIAVTFVLDLAWQTGLGAEQKYVTDVFKITLRTGPSVQNKIVTMLGSGQPLEVLETKDDWSRVRLLNRENETEGWVMSRYLITRQPWEQQARSLTQENRLLKQKFDHIETEWKETGGREKEAVKELREKTWALDKLSKEYEALKKGAANYLKLKKDYDATKSTLTRSQKRVDDLTRENNILLASQNYKWFGMGALVLLCGLLIGLLMGRHQKRQKTSILYD